jgi:hypothetical protein
MFVKAGAMFETNKQMTGSWVVVVMAVPGRYTGAFHSTHNLWVCYWLWPDVGLSQLVMSVHWS